MHNVLQYFEKTDIFTRRIVYALFHDAKFGHTFININKQLNWNVLQYTTLCLQFILSVYLIAGAGNVMCVCLYQKNVCKEYRTEGVNCRYIQYIRILVFVQSRRVNLFIVNCLL